MTIDLDLDLDLDLEKHYASPRTSSRTKTRS
jgi:hypothetical protein